MEGEGAFLTLSSCRPSVRQTQSSWLIRRTRDPNQRTIYKECPYSLNPIHAVMEDVWMLTANQ